MSADVPSCAPLPDAFLDWWFAPWRAAPTAGLHQGMDGVLARRDGYRLWCAQLDLTPGLPSTFDPSWAEICGIDCAALAAPARLFGGLLAARAQDAVALAALPSEERDWCLRTASTQPLVSHGRHLYLAGDTLELRGLCELACHLQTAFPGLWPRLRAGLDNSVAARINELLSAMASPLDATGGTRVHRCWRLCRVRADQTR